MIGCSRNMWFSLILYSLYFSSSCAFDLGKLELLDNKNYINDYKRDDSDEVDELNFDKLEISVGAIIGIAIGTVIVLFLVPILLCCWCAWCCFSSRKNKSTVERIVVAAPVPQYVPQQHNNADVHSQVAITQTYGSTNDVNQNASKDSVYPGSSDNFHATQPTNQYYNYNNGIPDSGPSSSTNNQSHIYEQPPPYYDVVAQSSEQYQSESKEASKSTTTDN